MKNAGVFLKKKIVFCISTSARSNVTAVEGRYASRNLEIPNMWK